MAGLDCMVEIAKDNGWEQLPRAIVTPKAGSGTKQSGGKLTLCLGEGDRNGQGEWVVEIARDKGGSESCRGV